MSTERRKRMLLAVLMVLLAAALYRAWPRSISTAASPERVSTASTGPAEEMPQGPPGLNLEALDMERPKPVALRRNLFRFAESRPAPDREPASESPQVAAEPRPVQPRVVAAQISLKLIGIVEAPGQAERVAVLSDERGVYHGREGDIIEGRYRILRITTESVEVSRIDADARHVIRLSGTTVP